MSSRPNAPTAQSLSARRRLLDDAAAQLVAAWDTDLDARASDDDRRPNPTASADYKRSHSAIVSTAPHSATRSPSAGVPTLSVELPAGFAARLPAGFAARLSSLQSTAFKRWPWVLGAVGLFAALALWAASDSDAEPAPVVAASHAQNAAEGDTHDEAGHEGENAGQAATQLQHTLVVRTVPPDASLRLDGVAVDNPYSARHTPTQPLHLVATAEGHRPAERDLWLSEDMNLMITLSPDPKADRPPAVTKRKARPKVEKKSARKRRAQRQKTRVGPPKARRRPAKKSSSGFVSNNPYR